MKSIYIIIDPDGTHIETCTNYNTSLELMLKLSEMVNNFTKIGFRIDNDTERQLGFWVLDSNYNNIMYVYAV